MVSFFILAGAGFWFYVYYVRTVEDPSIENEKADEPEYEMKGKDVDAIKNEMHVVRYSFFLFFSELIFSFSGLVPLNPWKTRSIATEFFSDRVLSRWAATSLSFVRT